MLEIEQKVYETLEQLNIPYQCYKHPPVYTVEQAKEYWQNITGAHLKNLFLRNSRGNRYYLVILEQSKDADLKELSERLNAGRLSFASERCLSEVLNLEAGAVSPFGLINDLQKAVTVVIDRALESEETVNFHPNVNTATVSIANRDFRRFLKHCGNEIIYI